MADLLIEMGLEKSDTGPFVILRRNPGGYSSGQGRHEIIADGGPIGSARSSCSTTGERTRHANTAR